jgi:transcriptional regulator of acetoin/glycerol metabolism
MASAAGVAGAARAAYPAPAAESIGPGMLRDGWSLEQVEKDHIARVLQLHHGNATSAAKQLGISRTTLWRKLRAFGLSRKALEG